MVDEASRKVITRMLKAGVLSKSEAARMAGVTRQAVAKWCKASGIDVGRRRHARLAREFRRRLERKRQSPANELRQKYEP